MIISENKTLGKADPQVIQEIFRKNLEEIQDQISICAKREIKVQKRNKSSNRKGKIKVQIEKGK